MLKRDSSEKTALRYLRLLQLIPRFPRMTGTSELHDTLAREGITVSRRTIERDLDMLSAAFSFSCEKQGRAQKWFYPPGCKLFQLPSLEPAAALALHLACKPIENLLPVPVLCQLRPYVKAAEQLLNDSGSYGRWRDKVHAMNRGPELRTPEIAPDVHAGVCEALLTEKQLKGEYCRRGASESKVLTLNPLGLVLKDAVLYLVATANQYSDIYQYALHRFKNVVVSDKAAIAVVGFNLAQYSEEKFGYPRTEQWLCLKMRISTGMAQHLEERVLSENQVITKSGQEFVLTANVDNTEELRWWLLGFGDQIEVIEPESLRRELGGTLTRAAERYAVCGNSHENR